MTAIEIKTEIQKVINEVPESLLVDVLNYIKHLQAQTENDVKANIHIKKILKEDAELLKKIGTVISITFAIQLHNILIDEFGGLRGVRDLAALEAALARPFATFDQCDLYPTILEKAAALFESLIINHPFVDGNKRIAYALTRFLIIENNHDIVSNQQEKYDMVIAASTGQIRYDEILNWLKKHAVTT